MDKISRIVCVSFIVLLFCLMLVGRSAAQQADVSELSMMATFQIRQAKEYCEKNNNALTHKEYWGDSIEPESLGMICMAEQFAVGVASDGYQWLNTKAKGLIEECKAQAKKEKDKRIYPYCLQKNLQKEAVTLSAPCAEMGEKNLWDEQACRQLVAYIFIQDFEEVLEESMTSFERFQNTFEKINQNIVVKVLINPIVAIIVLVLFVLDVVLVVTPGNWTQVSKLSMFLGPLILLACLFKGGIRFFLSLFIIVALLLIIFWNHNKSLFKSKKKESNVKIID